LDAIISENNSFCILFDLRCSKRQRKECLLDSNNEYALGAGYCGATSFRKAHSSPYAKPEIQRGTIVVDSWRENSNSFPAQRDSRVNSRVSYFISLNLIQKNGKEREKMINSLLKIKDKW